MDSVLSTSMPICLAHSNILRAPFSSPGTPTTPNATTCTLASLSFFWRASVASADMPWPKPTWISLEIFWPGMASMYRTPIELAMSITSNIVLLLNVQH